MTRQTLFAFQLFGLALILGTFSGCAGRQTRIDPAWTAGLPLKAAVKEVPFYRQREFQCGPAALAMVLTWSGKPTRPDQIAAKVFTPSIKGSLQPAMVTGARRSGRLAYEIKGAEALLQEIAGGHPVIVLLNLGLSWFPIWHYAVVIGYDATAGDIYLHSGPSANKAMARDLFQRTWARGRLWGLLVIPPDQFPAAVDESRYLKAALGLERAGQFTASLAAYQNALLKWPENLIALMGVGNSHYALKDLSSSAAAFEETARRHPSSADAFNNLAHVLFELDRPQEAERAALRAVALGGANAKFYHQTLKLIQSGGNKP